MENFNYNEDSSYVMYLDKITNFYRIVMMYNQQLPADGFKWDKISKLISFEVFIKIYKDTSNIGYFLKVKFTIWVFILKVASFFKNGKIG